VFLGYLKDPRDGARLRWFCCTGQTEKTSPNECQLRLHTGMKILHVSTGFGLSFPGGITNYVRSLARAQVGFGDEVHVLARPEDHSQSKGLILQPFLPSRVRPFSLKLVDDDPKAWEVWALIERERYDLIHFHMALDLPMRLLRKFSESQIPYVVSLHDYFYVCPRIIMVDFAKQVCRSIQVRKCTSCIGRLDQVDLLRRASHKLKVRLPRIPSSAAGRRLRQMKSFLGSARLLLAVSNRTAEIYKEVVPEGRFEVEQIGNESANCQLPERVRSSRIRLTFLGTLNYSKGAGVLEKLMNSVRRRDVEFHFYGHASAEFERLRSYGLLLHGGYRPEDIPGIMANTDIGLVLPIWEDNGPQVAMEFVNFKVPVIGTRRGGIPDIVSPENGVLFDPDDSAEFRSAVDWIDSVTMDQLGMMSAGMKRLKTPEQHAARVRDLYESILCRPVLAETSQPGEPAN
jgi:glycosyltransferase involved in cell wall biosynthesis